MKKKVVIIGTRGIPASYSGFETSVQETSIRFVERDIETTVLCRKNHYKVLVNEYKGVKLKYIPSIKSKHLDTLTHTLLSIIFLITNLFDIVIVYGVGNSIFIPLLKMLKYPVISVVDGADWERQKWGKFAKAFLRFNRFFAVKFSNYYVVDNEYLASIYKNQFDKEPIYIPYGANQVFTNNHEFLEKYNLEKDKYIIFVGRFVKEKGIDFLINNFNKLDTDKKLVVVGDNDIDITYVNFLKSLAGSNIIFTGFLYGSEYETLLHNALFYVSCSFLEGTSPSLLSAMAINGFALVSNLIENIEVLKSSCATFEVANSVDFIEKMNYYLNNQNVIIEERKKTKDIIERYYTWDKITDQYIDLFNKLIKK